MQGRNVIRAVLFVVFFSIGTAALSSSILCDDLVRYYQNKELLTEAQESLNRLRSLNDEYDILLNRLKEDPNLIVERLAPATLGPDPNLHDPNTVYPRATAEQLAAARRALMTDTNESTRGRAPAQAMPRWLSRCSEPRRRIMLFVCGVVLILTSFVCFRPPKQTVENTDA
ncbi:MAG: hypothetical protein JSW66_17980 [Phycisphaerales bacterium]|nr:MAG: hypothetical protein JSW66_17980 [Phycisphaerales bacterium]